VSLFVWGVRSTVDSLQKMEIMITRQADGYRRVETIEHNLHNLEERVRKLEIEQSHK
jgi:hypothetical protein